MQGFLNYASNFFNCLFADRIRLKRGESTTRTILTTSQGVGSLMPEIIYTTAEQVTIFTTLMGSPRPELDGVPPPGQGMIGYSLPPRVRTE